MTLAQELPGIRFAYTDTAEYIIGRAELPGSRLVVHRGQEWYDAHVFEGKTYKEMRDFIILETHRGVIRETHLTDELVRQGHVPALRVLCHEAESCIPYIKLLNESNHHGHKLIKVYKILSSREYVTENKTEYETEAKLQESHAHIEILDSRRGHLHHHKYEGRSNMQDLEEFIESYFRFRKHAHHYSEHAEDHIHSIVKSITGHNYEREVVHTRKSIVVLVHNGLPEEEDLRNGFRAAALWMHEKKICKYAKFRMLNQRDNLTPIPYHSKPTLLLIKLHMQNDPGQFYEQTIDAEGVTKRALYKLLKEKASLLLSELDSFLHEIEAGEMDTDL